MTQIIHDSAYFRRRAAEARSAAFCKDHGESVEIAGELALAYAALARRRDRAGLALTAELPTVEPGLLVGDEAR